MTKAETDTLLWLHTLLCNYMHLINISKSWFLQLWPDDFAIICWWYSDAKSLLLAVRSWGESFSVRAIDSKAFSLSRSFQSESVNRLTSAVFTPGINLCPEWLDGKWSAPGTGVNGGKRWNSVRTPITRDAFVTPGVNRDASPPSTWDLINQDAWWCRPWP